MVPTPADLPWTAEEQIAAMRDEQPSFMVIHAAPWIVLWHGRLKPFCREYEVQLLYSAITLPLASIEARQVHVEVLNPLLSRRDSQPDATIPHIYRNPVSPSRPRLCLHKPQEWSERMLISRSIVPWTIEWLVAYEGWRATGQWFAGGHNTERDSGASSWPRSAARRLLRKRTSEK